MDTTVREIRRTRPESGVAPDSELPQAIPHVGQESNTNVTPIDTRAKTKAQIMREWRESQGESNWTQTPIATYHIYGLRGQTPRDTDLLLRDMLYLLQGIDGKYARFAKKSRFEKQKELNPYLVDTTMQRPGARDDKGMGRQLEEVLADDEEIRGIDFVDPDGQVCLSANATSTWLTSKS